MEINILEAFEYNQHFVSMMNIINTARLNPPNKGHRHHIIPRCWFKKNNLTVDGSKNNVILLTVEDHAKVHKLAYLCSNEQIKSALAYAALLMNKTNHSINKKDIQRTPWNKGKKGAQVCWCKGKHLSEEHKKHIKETHAHSYGSQFTDKFIEHFKISRCDNVKLYRREHMFYIRHNNTCRWELKDYKPYNTGKHWVVINGVRTWLSEEE